MDASRIPPGLGSAALHSVQATQQPAPSPGVQPQRRVSAAQVAPDPKPAEGTRQAMLLARVHAAAELPRGQPSGRASALVVAGLLAPGVTRSPKT